jgi:4-carboxymuconolactone decarboxylase
MPRIPYPTPESLDDEARRCMQGVPPINVLRMLSHSGPLLAGFGAFGQRVLYSLDLDPVLREMVIVRVGHLCRCGYELAQHERFLADLGVAPEKIPAIATGAAHAALTPLEQAVLAFTDDVVTNVRASDATLSELSNHLPPRQVVELIMTAGCYRMLCMMLETCGVEIEDGGEAHRMTQAEWQSRMQQKQQSLPE